MPRYLIQVTDQDAFRLESWLGSRIQLFPAAPWADPLADLRVSDGESAWVPDYNRAEADRRLALTGPVAVASLDAVEDEEVAAILERLRTGGPHYHAGGPG